MINVSNRAFQRNHYEARIRYAIYGTENFISAKMYNTSEGGMYFESDDELLPASEIRIMMVDVPSDISPEARNGYRAEVVWCRKIFKKDGTSCYGVGVRFIVNVCDKCGETVSYTEIERTDDFIFLCPRCVRYLEAMSGDKIKETVASYLLGNVI